MNEKEIRRSLLQRFTYGEVGIKNLLHGHQGTTHSVSRTSYHEGILEGLAMARKYLDEVLPDE